MKQVWFVQNYCCPILEDTKILVKFKIMLGLNLIDIGQGEGNPHQTKLLMVEMEFRKQSRLLVFRPLKTIGLT